MRSFILASAGVWPALRRLHRLQAVTTFSQVWAPVLTAGDYVVQGQVLRLLAAVLAGKPVAQKHFFLGELAGEERTLYQIDQPDDSGRIDLTADGVQAALVLLQQFCLALVHHDDGATDGADVNRHVVQVKHQHRCSNQHTRVGPFLFPVEGCGRTIHRGHLSFLNHCGQ